MMIRQFHANSRRILPVCNTVSRNIHANAVFAEGDVVAAPSAPLAFASPKYRVPLQKSHSHGACDIPLLTSTLGEAFSQTTSAFADSPFATSVHQPSNHKLSYAEVADKVDTLALSLTGLGFVHGDRIAIWSSNNVEWLVTMYAAAKLGLVLVNLNPAYQQHELKYTLNKVQCKGLVFAQKFKATSNLASVQALFPEAAQSPYTGSIASTYKPITSAEVPSMQHLIHLGIESGADVSNATEIRGMLNFPDLLNYSTHFASDTEKISLISKCSADDIANIQFTSGTTGFPKATALTHTNILNNGYFVGETIKLTDQDRILLSVPLFHCFGMVMGSIAAVTHGSSVVIPSATFSPVKSILAAANEKCTILHGVPTMFITMLASPEFHTYQAEIKKNSRSGIMAGSPCPEAVMRQVIDDMGIEHITVCYGMTETSPVSLQTHTDDPLLLRVGTVGRTHPHLEVKIADEEGKPVDVGVSGEICTRGYSVMKGYWDGEGIDHETTNISIDLSGWMHTGDIGVMDANGFVRVVGRVKDLIIRGGENVQPREIEELLYTHPLIQDAQVIGVPDDVMGEEVAVWVILRSKEDAQDHIQTVSSHIATNGTAAGSASDTVDSEEVVAAASAGVHAMTEQEVKAFVGATLAKYKIPKYVKFVDSFPMTVSGKVQKYVMRKMYSEELGLKH